MDTISYEYTKQRKQFGLHPTFADSPLVYEAICAEPPTPPPQAFDPNDPSQQFTPLSPMMDEEKLVKSKAQWVEAIAGSVELDCIPSQSSHEVNTERYLQHAKGTSHTEGAWPAEIKTNEYVDRQRYVRRLINEPAYQNAVVSLTKQAETVIAQSNIVDCYETYFSQIEETLPSHAHDGDFYVSPPSAKTLCVLRDPNPVKRAATKISWHPDAPHKLAVSYAITAFQSQPPEMSCHSYIWDMTSPNHPDAKLLPSSPLTTLAYNPRSPDQIVGGAFNGILAFFDLRKGAAPVECSVLEKSHHDPVYDVLWVQSRSGNECCSISTDGQLLWWDIRKLRRGYTDSMWLQNEGDSLKMGGCSMEYKSDAGATRFLVGTEQGASILCDRKAKKDAESTKSVKAIYGVSASTGGHHGSVCSIQRSPFNLKYFLTCGDWSSKIWMEDLREPIIVNRYEKAYVSSAQWSYTRPGVYFTAKSDGVLDIFDLYHRQESPVYSLRVSDQPLTVLKAQSNGRNLAIGDKQGSVTVLAVSRGLVEVQKDEKTVITAMLERETKREKALEVRKAQAKRDAGKTATQSLAASTIALDLDSNETKEALQRAEEEFFVQIDSKSNEHEEFKEGPSNVITSINEMESEFEQKEQFSEFEEKTNSDGGVVSPQD